MVSIRLCREYAGIELDGHAGFAEKGNDIVCAAVSVLVFNYMHSLEKLLAVKPLVYEDKNRNLLKIKLDPQTLDREIAEKTMLLYDSMVTGLTEVLNRYPDHVKVTETGGNNGS